MAAVYRAMPTHTPKPTSTATIIAATAPPAAAPLNEFTRVIFSNDFEGGERDEIARYLGQAQATNAGC